MIHEIGKSIAIPAEFSREIKVLHDKALKARSGARHAINYDLWMRIFALIPDTLKGTWAIRHGLTKVHLVKLDDANRDI